MHFHLSVRATFPAYLIIFCLIILIILVKGRLWSFIKQLAVFFYELKLFHRYVRRVSCIRVYFL
jgi:hypothetical protein